MPSPPDDAAFHAALWTGALKPALTARDPSEAPRRFGVYRSNLVQRLAQALAARCPVVQRLAGVAFFAAMAAEFARAHPPAAPVLLAWGGAFPGFLETFPPVAGLPNLPDVARLEIALGRAHHDTAPLGPEALAALADRPGDARPALHPSVQVVASRFAVVSIREANQPDAAPRRDPASLLLRLVRAGALVGGPIPTGAAP